MKQCRKFFVLIAALVVPIGTTAPVFAATQVQRATPESTGSITHELHVTAVVPHHRDIIIDRRGQILQITSNTTEDVQPEVYVLSSNPKNKRDLTPELYKTYRMHVPEGTAKYGVLYEAEFPRRLTVAPSRRL